MIILTDSKELEKFPKPVYAKAADDDSDTEPTLIKPMPYWYEILSQNYATYECVIKVEGDIGEFMLSDIKFTEIDAIPAGFNQQCVDGAIFGRELTLDEITEINENIEYLGADANDITSLSELRLLKRMKDLDVKVDEAKTDIEELRK